MEGTPAAVLDDTVVALDAVLQSGAVRALDAGEMMDLLRLAGEIQRRVEAVIVETVASADPRPAGSGEPAFCGRFGCRSMNELLQRVLRTDGASAARVVKAARLVRREVDLSSGEWLPARWPALREALLDGAIGVTGLLAATGPIEQAGPRVRLADRWEADAYLADVARGEESCDGADSDGAENSDDAQNEPGPAPTPEELRVRAQLIVQYLDPDGAEPAEDIALRARGVVLGRAKDGVIPVRGALLPEVAGQLQRIWDAYLNPKVDGPPLPGVHFVPSAELADAEQRDTAVSPDDDVLPAGDPGGMVDGRTRAQKQHDALAAALGIAARHDDMPRLGGAAPTLVVTIHHVTEHAHGGPTHTDNGVALCWHHHRTLDTSGWQIRMREGVPQ
ncbi:unnamed protein product, partial [Penicillium discolor]